MILYISSLIISFLTLILTILILTITMAFSEEGTYIFRIFGAERAYLFLGISFVLLVLGFIVDYKNFVKIKEK